VPAARPGPYPISWSTVMGRTGSRPGWVVVLAGSVVWAAVVAFASRPLTGLVAGALVGAGCWWPRGRLAVRAAALAALVSLPVYVTAQQAMHSYWPDINWPAELSLANDLAWLGVALLGADVVVGVLRDRAGARRYARGGKDARS
ncbi:MAG: hypothetical protein ACRDWW_05435, partial [Acidimicrobiales bacterium]